MPFGSADTQPGTRGMSSTSTSMRDTLAAIAAHTNVIGLDFVEVNPQLDVGTGITAYLGARTVLEFLGQICDQSGWVARREARSSWRRQRCAPGPVGRFWVCRPRP